MATRVPLIELLQDRVDSLSKAQRALAHYVLRNYQSVAFSTISELAQHAGVSEATVVRFANTLGFSGYPPFQKEVRRIVRADLKGTERFSLKAQPGVPLDDPLGSAIRKELENIAHLEAMVDRAALAEASTALREASAVLVVGARSTAALAQHLWFALDKLRLPAGRILSVDTEAFAQVDRLPTGACVVVIGFPRYLKSLVALLEAARARGLRSIVVTDSPFSALKGDIGLHAPAESSSFVAFHCAPLILVNALIDSVGQADRQAALAALQQFETLAERLGFFQPP
jgi:DNA-binding MurR/RpiR family transcriptional regulator